MLEQQSPLGGSSRVKRRRFFRSGAHVAVVAAALLALVGSGISPAAPATAAPSDQFAPTDSSVFIAQHDPTGLYKAQVGDDGATTFEAEGANSPLRYNAIGYNTLDDFLYGIVTGSGTAELPNGSIIRIGQEGTLSRVGTAVHHSDYYSGTVYDGVLYAHSSTRKVMIRVDLATGEQIGASIAIPNAVATSGYGGGQDIAELGGYFWSAGFGYLVRIDPGTGATSRWSLNDIIPVPRPAQGDSAGGAWTYGNGNLGFIFNVSGRVFQIRVDHPAAAQPAFTLVSQMAGPASSNNDATASPGGSTNLSVVKTGPATFVPGERISYDLTITNHGTVNSSGWVLTDQLPASLANPTIDAGTGCAISGSTLSCVGKRLAVGDSRTISLSADAPPVADLCVTNTARVVANEFDPEQSNNSSAVTTCGAGISLVKTALAPVDVNGNGITDEGDRIGYSFLIANTGKVALSAVAINDPLVGQVDCAVTVLAAGESMTCLSADAHTITAAEVAAGVVVNTATASAIPAGLAAPMTSAPATATVPVEAPTPGIVLTKSATPSTLAGVVAGQEIVYSFVVENTGNLPLAGVSITEDAFGGFGVMSPVVCAGAEIPVGGHLVCTASYVVLQADLDNPAQNLSNTARAEGTPTGMARITSAPSSVSLPFDHAPVLALTKRVASVSAQHAGATVSYEFVVKNTGNVTLTDATVSEVAFSGTGVAPTATCPTTPLIPGASLVCSAPYVLTQSDVDNGVVTNTATARAMPPVGAAVESAEAAASLHITAAPALTLVKQANRTQYDAVGQTITYAFGVTNTGNVSISDIGIDELAFTGAGALSGAVCPSGALAPEDTVTCEATYDVGQADIDAGLISNSASAYGTAPAGGRVSSPVASAQVDAVQTSLLGLAKTVSAPAASVAGETVTYSFDVTNLSNTTLVDVTIAELAFSGSGPLDDIFCPVTRSILVPGESAQCRVSYELTQADIDAGEVTNSAEAVARNPRNTEVRSAPSSAAVPLDRSPALLLVKTAEMLGGADIVEGNTVSYSFVATNTGNVTIEDVEISEVAFTGANDLSAIGCNNVTRTLAPGEQLVCGATYRLATPDLVAGVLENTAIASGLDPTGAGTESEPASASLPAEALPRIGLVKTADLQTVAREGETITYSFAVTNLGNVTLSGVAVREVAFTGHGTLTAVHCPGDALRPAQAMTCTANYKVVTADLTGLPLQNTAVASATGPKRVSEESVAEVATAKLVLADTLPATGGQATWPWALAAVGAGAIGLALLLRARTQREGRG